MTAPAAPAKPRLSMPCWLEHNGAAIHTLERKAAWHADCPPGDPCSCPGHHRAWSTEVTR